MKTLPTKEQLAKTKFGIIESLDELFDGFLYFRQASAPGRGSWAIKPDGWYFMSGIYTGQRVITFPPGHRHPGPCLYTKPKKKVVDAVMERAMEGKMGSFELVNWVQPPKPENPREAWMNRPGAGYTAIFATDSTSIPQVWLGFIDTDNLPEINESNTKIWTPGDPE